MKDLIASYAEAKFGKEAAASLPIQTGLRRFVSGYFPEDNKQTESLRAIRDAIESSIRQEKRLRGRARTETEYATHRATRARAGTLTSPRWNIKPYPAAQLGSWVTGGLLGRRAALRDPAVLKQLMSGLAEGKGGTAGVLKELQQWGLPKTMKAVKRVAGKRVTQQVPIAAMTAVQQLPKLQAARSHLLAMARAAKLKIPWKGRAAIYAAVASAPFLLINLLRNRAIRAKGGPEAVAAAQKAEHWLEQAEQTRKWRSQQLSQLELAGAPKKYRLLPFTR